MSEAATRGSRRKSRQKDRRSGASKPAGSSSTGPTLHFRVARVSPDPLNLRAEPTTASAVLGRLAEGTLVEPLGPARDADGHVWVKVETPDDLEGWASAMFLDIVAAMPEVAATPVPAPEPSAPGPEPEPQREPAASAGRFRVNTDGIRLREGPGTDTAILTELRSGTLVDDDGGDTVVATGFEWRRIRVDGQTGWMATQFLSPARGGRRRFNADTPTELQRQDWTCSIRSTMWVLKSLGVDVTPEQAQDAMSPQYVRSDVGLLDASGAGIVAVLREVWGIEAFNRAPVSFDDVAGWAGRYPIALGGRNWYHWSAVRGYDPGADVLVMANPGGTGPRFGQQTLNRQQFEDLGWFSAVVVPVD
ncbi:MAG: SH3 domain-containing protein [Chloroflexota bacterium]